MTLPGDDRQVLERELQYHEHLYSGFAQNHFAKPAVRAFRSHSAQRIRNVIEAGPRTRLLSLGCGIADTELLIAPNVQDVVGVDLSSAAIQQAQVDARRMAVNNAHFIQGTLADIDGEFDAIIAVFFLHHLPDRALGELPGQLLARLAPGGLFYSLDPNRSRLSGAIGRLLVPGLMKKYETEDERELAPEATAALFDDKLFDVTYMMYDFASTPLAGLFPGWRMGYNVARHVDDAVLRIPFLRRWGSNFEIIARRKPGL